MRGNLHVRFLGEGAAARRPPYPTAYDGSIPFTRSNLPGTVIEAILRSTEHRASLP